MGWPISVTGREADQLDVMVVEKLLRSSPPARARTVHAAAPHTDGMNMKVLPGRASPSHTLPRAGVWGNLVSPHPAPKDQV